MLFVVALLAVVAAGVVYFNAKKRANKQESSLALVALRCSIHRFGTMLDDNSSRSCWCY